MTFQFLNLCVGGVLGGVGGDAWGCFGGIVVVCCRDLGGKIEETLRGRTDEDFHFLFFNTPSSMNRLFSEFFREFSGVILEGCETIWGSFWRCFGRMLKEKHRKNY